MNWNFNRYFIPFPLIYFKLFWKVTISSNIFVLERIFSPAMIATKTVSYVFCMRIEMTRIAASRLRRHAGLPSYRVILRSGICCLLSLVSQHSSRSCIQAGAVTKFLHCHLSLKLFFTMFWFNTDLVLVFVCICYNKIKLCNVRFLYWRRYARRSG